MAKAAKHLNTVYYKYFIRDDAKKETYRHDMRPFFNNFVSIKNSPFKNSFGVGDDKFYLIPINISGSYPVDFYYFISTRSNDIAKVIEESQNDINIDDLENKLQTNQQLGFSSYIMIAEDYISLSSSFLSPKASTFADFTNQIMRHLSICDKIEFRLETFPLSITKKEALKMSVIGKTTFKVQKSSGLLQQFVGVLNTDPENLESIEVSFTPKRNASITTLGKKIVEEVADHYDSKKLIIKAKKDFGDTFQEYYVLNSSKLKDTLKVKSDLEVCPMLYSTAQQNDLLRDDLREFRNENPKTTCGSMASFDKFDIWRSTITN